MDEKTIWEKVYTLRKGDMLFLEFRRPASVEWEVWDGAKVMAEASRDPTDVTSSYAAVKPPGTSARGRSKAIISFPQDGNNGTTKVEYRTIRKVIPVAELSPDPRFRTPTANPPQEEEENEADEDDAEDDTSAYHYPEYYEDPGEWVRIMKEPLDREMLIQHFARFESQWTHWQERHIVREIMETLQALVRMAYDVPSITENSHFLVAAKKLITRLKLQERRMDGAGPLEVEALRQGLDEKNEAKWFQVGLTRAADRLRIMKANDSRTMAGMSNGGRGNRGQARGRGGGGRGGAKNAGRGAGNAE
jgi:hypothetical protein